jgi:NADH-quinone oxidoreductase subunit A
VLEDYLHILIFIVVALLIGFVPRVLGMMLGPRRPDREKDSPYECGFEAFETPA